VLEPSRGTTIITTDGVGQPGHELGPDERRSSR
jgi:hypothetical protein